MSKKNSKDKTLSSNYETTISLLNVYLAEWTHRDQLLYSHFYKLFYAILIVILLPNISDFLKINLPSIPSMLFRICGLILSFIYLYVTLGYIKRLETIGNTYQSIINRLPEEYRRQSISELNMGVLFKPRLAYVICFVLFLILFLLSIILIFI